MEHTIKKADLLIWLKKLKNAWINKDIDAILSIFSQTKRYFEDPFCPPGTNTDDIKSFWEEIKNQNIIKLDLIPLAIDGNKVIINWCFKFSDIANMQNVIELDGIYFIIFNENFECVEFKQWWVSKE